MRTNTPHQTEATRHPEPARAIGRSPDMIPLYDVNQFAGLIERERARADRAAVRAPHTVHRRTPKANADAAAKPNGAQPKPSTDGVWGATTNNREFSLVVFRPRTRADRGGLVELLISTVRTTDAVGIIDVRRLGVLLPDTAAENAVLFVKKILAAAEELGVALSHVVHTYPAAWPDDASPSWDDAEHAHENPHEKDHGKALDPNGHAVNARETTRHRRAIRAEAETGVVKTLVNWLQAATLRRPTRKTERAEV